MTVATTPTSLAATRADLAAALVAAGVPNVSTDPRLQPPGVLVDAPSLIEPIGAAAGWSVTYVVKVVSPPPGDADALTWLLETTQQVLQALGVLNLSARSTTVTLNGKDCPAYVVEYVVVVTNPEPCP